MKKLLSAVLAAALLMLPAFAEFEDVDAEAWYASAAEWADEKGLMSGVSETEFAPDGAVTRGMAVTILYRLAGSPELPESDWGYAYEDVEPGSWYALPVYWARLEGVAGGVSDTSFDPDGSVTREQLVTMLWRYAGSPDGEYEADFADAGEISSWALDAAAWAAGEGLVSGREGNVFDPLGGASRAECAAIIKRYCDSHPGGEPEYEPNLELLERNGYDPGGFTVSDGRIYYAGARTGIDVSAHQGEIDWQAVAADGIEFAVIRVGYRGYSEGELFMDEYFEANITGALENGLEVGVYFFSQALTVEEALEEAAFTLEAIAPYEISGPVVFDWERITYDGGRTAGAGPMATTTCARAFCEEMESWGYRPMAYVSPNTANRDIYLDLLTDYPLWLAHYTKELEVTDFEFHYDMWQYTSTGTVDGIDGNVDINIDMTGAAWQ